MVAAESDEISPDAVADAQDICFNDVQLTRLDLCLEHLSMRTGCYRDREKHRWHSGRHGWPPWFSLPMAVQEVSAPYSTENTCECANVPSAKPRSTRTESPFALLTAKSRWGWGWTLLCFKIFSLILETPSSLNLLKVVKIVTRSKTCRKVLFNSFLS